MVTRTRIRECMQGLVGWRESAKAGVCYDALPDSLKRSDSGLYFNALSGVTLELVNDSLGQRS